MPTFGAADQDFPLSRPPSLLKSHGLIEHNGYVRVHLDIGQGPITTQTWALVDHYSTPQTSTYVPLLL